MYRIYESYDDEIGLLTEHSWVKHGLIFYAFPCRIFHSVFPEVDPVPRTSRPNSQEVPAKVEETPGKYFL